MGSNPCQQEQQFYHKFFAKNCTALIPIQLTCTCTNLDRDNKEDTRHSPPVRFTSVPHTFGGFLYFFRQFVDTKEQKKSLVQQFI